jgi:hypothetical protein
MYTYKKNDEFVYPVNLSSKHNGIGGWHLKTDEERAEEEFYRLVAVDSVAEPHQIRSTFADIVLDEETLICTATYTLTDKSLKYYKDEKILEAKKLRDIEAAARPPVDTGLGFSVDGSATDLDYFEIGKLLDMIFVIDSDGESQPIILADWETILNAVAVYRLSILQKYWTHKTAIEAATTLSEVGSIEII